MGELPQAWKVAAEYIVSVWVKGRSGKGRAGRAPARRPVFRLSGKGKRGECFHSPRDWLEIVVQGWFKAGARIPGRLA